MSLQTTQLQQLQQKQTKKPIQKQTQTSKAIIFDSGALISFSMNGITDMIRNLKKIFKGKFLITREIKKEIIDTPIKIKRFQLEAIKLRSLLEEGVLEMPSSLGISDDEISKQTANVLEMANTAFHTGSRDIHLIDIGEASGIALSRVLTERGIHNVIAIDERTTRTLVENHKNQKKFLEKKLHVKISINHEKVKFFTGFKIIRSAELVYIAYKKGLIKSKNPDILDALLYAVKFKGAAISGDEIREMENLK